MTIFSIALGIAAALLGVLAVSIGWRIISRRTHAPCPAWLAWSLELPGGMKWAGGISVLDRLAIAPGMRVADVGCGPGRLTIPMAERVGPRGEVVALDIQEAMLAKLQRRIEEKGLRNIKLIHAGAGDGMLPSDTFDRAVLVTVLGEIPDREKALREIYKSLKPGGILSVTESLPDPHFQRRSVVRSLAERVGFACGETFGGRFAFTMHLHKRTRGV